MKLLRYALVIVMSAAAASAASGEVWGSAKSKVYHYRLCRWNAQIKPEYKVSFPSPAAARKAGYQPCGTCRPPGAENRDHRRSAEKEGATHNRY
jgi:methylphosphotriester-DNA--protein-cysteine methyltransferase